MKLYDIFSKIKLINIIFFRFRVILYYIVNILLANELILAFIFYFYFFYTSFHFLNGDCPSVNIIIIINNNMKFSLVFLAFYNCKIYILHTIDN